MGRAAFVTCGAALLESLVAKAERGFSVRPRGGASDAIQGNAMRRHDGPSLATAGRST
jgi:hypothetical protein